jgi:alpha-N-arabinofuranosidase
MDELVRRHAAIMERYDPDKRVGLIVDEWGTWFDVEPGTNPGFLYQQNTLRDALVAGLTLHIFHAHADRVRMANIAQTVNVLQAVVLTDGPRLLLTPTYHVFEMFQGHQNATLLPAQLTTDVYARGDQSIPSLSASASRNGDDGPITLSLCHTDPTRETTLTCDLRGANLSDISSARVLTAQAINAHNTFDRPDQIRPLPFDGARLENGNRLSVTLPPASVAVLELSPA